MKTKIILISIFALFVSIAKGVEKSTFIYSIKGQDTLRLDKYDLKEIEGKKPCVLFVFGGGFVGGVRNNPNQLPYFEYLTQQGYVVVSIDYRLGVKKAQETGKINFNTTPVELFSIFQQSVDMAVEDLFDATHYILQQSEIWNINSEMIIASGSSAGALTVLHAEYELCNESQLSQKLPSSFNYAGIISFAGGIFHQQELTWKRQPAPTLFFHGDADSHVPYEKLHIADEVLQMDFRITGGKGLFDLFSANGYSAYLYTEVNAAHEISESAIVDNLDETALFLNRFVKAKKPLILETISKDTEKPEVNKTFDVFDYLKSNGMVLPPTP